MKTCHTCGAPVTNPHMPAGIWEDISIAPKDGSSAWAGYMLLVVDRSGRIVKGQRINGLWIDSEGTTFHAVLFMKIPLPMVQTVEYNERSGLHSNNPADLQVGP